MTVHVAFVPDGRVEAGRVAVEVPEGTTVKEAADLAAVDCPTFCMVPQMPPGSARPRYTRGSCGLCSVRLVSPGGRTELVPSCRYRLTGVDDGATVTVHDDRLDRARDTSAALTALAHHGSCVTCPMGTEDCELRVLLAGHDLGLARFPDAPRDVDPPDDSHPVLVQDRAKCVLCRRCETICPVDAVQFVGRGSDTRLMIDPDRCIHCGQCTQVCPAAAIVEKTALDAVREAVAAPEKVVTVQVAPAVRVAIGEAFGLPPGANLIGRLYTALRRLGFDAVFDTNFAADLTIMEEGTELVRRLGDGRSALPMFTSCCPGWVRYVETYWPDLLAHLSTCKSPQQMLGAVTKTWWAGTQDIDPASVVDVAVMPCTAKKSEAERPEMADSGHRDVDHVLTTRELVRWLRSAGIRLADLPDGDPTPMLSEQTGAAPLFGVTGGVLEAALRTVRRLVTGRELDGLELWPVRGLAGVREAEVDLGGGEAVRVAVVHGLENVPPVMEAVRAGRSPYTFVEVMACPGGCVGGGGQPHGFDMRVRQQRAAGLYAADAAMPKRRSHENAEVAVLRQALSDEERHHLLHTHYTGAVT